MQKSRTFRSRRLARSFLSWAALRSTPSIAMSIEGAARSPRSRNIVHVPSFAGTGVTSLLPVPSTNDHRYYAGTKRGKVRQIALPADVREGTLHKIRVRDVEDANGETLKPYPVFSMASVMNIDEGVHDLLAGGGDRHVTVWRECESDDGEIDAHPVWRVEDRLGPHTGWVKDLACQPISSREGDGSIVFSIGCNCIEVWSLVGGKFRHRHKLQIESSVEMGSTLSSDLLCLATHSDRGTTTKNAAVKTNYLFAGGVDGRIHRWTMHGNNQFINDGAIPSHSGRVNAMAVCKDMNVLVSVSNDGRIRCLLMNDRGPSSWEGATLDLERDDEIARKITALCIVRGEPESAIAAVGTACGRISLVEINKTGGCALQASVLTERNSIGLECGEGGTIHALCSKRHGNFCRVMIGHSVGLSVWDVSLP